MKKKKLLINASGSGNWIGGLYYKKNILYSLLRNQNITKQYQILIAVGKENQQIYNDFKKYAKIIVMDMKDKKKLWLNMLLLCIKERVNYIFPGESEKMEVFGIKPIYWIPDFQHKHYPDFFNESDRKERERRFQYIAKSKHPLILSSFDCLKDFRTFYSKDKENVAVVHFVSCIEKEIASIEGKKEKDIISKYGLEGIHYACIMNQFWRHKNHMTVLEAIILYKEENPGSHFKFVFTGMVEHEQNHEYIHCFMQRVQEKNIGSDVIVLGFIEREEQIAVMKNAEFVIQPSLFEGWGTVLEDAKVLDKTVLLSDISVHREQKNRKCHLFNPCNPEELSNLIMDETSIMHKDNVGEGIKRMKNDALKYSKSFQRLLDE